MRVAFRRSRALLRAGTKLLAADTRPFQAELRWAGEVLGAVRDLDVMLEHLAEEARTLDAGDAEAAEALLGRLADERDVARKVAARRARVGALPHAARPLRGARRAVRAGGRRLLPRLARREAAVAAPARSSSARRRAGRSGAARGAEAGQACPLHHRARRERRGGEAAEGAPGRARRAPGRGRRGRQAARPGPRPGHHRARGAGGRTADRTGARAEGARPRRVAGALAASRAARLHAPRPRPRPCRVLHHRRRSGIAA